MRSLWLISLLLIPAMVWGQTITGVTGTADDGASLVIAGSGFGTKTTAAPWKYDDFEDGADGSNLSSSWDFSRAGGGAVYPIYSDDVLRTGSTLSAVNRYINDQYRCTFGKDSSPGTFANVYMDFWVHTTREDELTRNWKMVRVYGEDDDYNHYMGASCTQMAIAADLVDCEWREYIDGYGAQSADSTWFHVQIYWESSTPETEDGKRHAWFDCAHVIDDDALCTRDAGDEVFHQAWFSQYMAHDAVGGCVASGDHLAYIDNAYIDITQSRVEIGDAASYDGCSHREIQIPSAWTTTEITFTANQGSFAAESTAYVFVIDSDGNVSAGSEITWGEDTPIGPETPDPVDSITVVEQ